MSGNEDFKDETSVIHLFIFLVVVLAMPLLPMLMGWYNALR